MHHYRKVVSALACLLLVPLAAGAAERSLPEKPRNEKLTITFNGETIRGYYNLIDARTPEQVAADEARGELAGPAMVFFTGHAQRPADAWKFSTLLARECRSGVVVVPICDTPYGEDKNWRGDAGKDAILMEMTRVILAGAGVEVQGYEAINSCPPEVDADAGGVPGTAPVQARLVSVGWSHGCIVARRFAHAHPGAVTGLAQMCPAGYAHWSTAGMLVRFSIEGLQIGGLSFTGHADDVFAASAGIVRGVVGDTARSWGDSVRDHYWGKPLRVCRDMRECARFYDGNNLPVPGVERVVVIFGKADDCMDVQKMAGITDADNPDPAEVDVFWDSFYPEAVSAGAECSFRVLPGSHLAPITHYEDYVAAVLAAEVLQGEEG